MTVIPKISIEEIQKDLGETEESILAVERFINDYNNSSQDKREAEGELEALCIKKAKLQKELSGGAPILLRPAVLRNPVLKERIAHQR